MSIRVQVGARNPNWRGDAAGYLAVHSRLTRTLGKASARPCAKCNQPASTWAYNHVEAPPERRKESRRGPFSTELLDYIALCFLCHGRFDHGETRYRGPRKLTALAVVAIKQRLRDGDTQRAIAADHAVHSTLIGAIKSGRVWAHVALPPPPPDPDAIPGEPPLAAARRRLKALGV